MQEKQEGLFLFQNTVFRVWNGDANAMTSFITVDEFT